MNITVRKIAKRILNLTASSMKRSTEIIVAQRDIARALEEAYEAGAADGYEAGYDAGSSEGRDQGYRDGRSSVDPNEDSWTAGIGSN